MRRVLFLSAAYPEDLDKAVFGLFQRMRILLDAAIAARFTLHLVFMVSQEEFRQIDSCEELGARISRRWVLDATVSFIVLDECRVNEWITFVAPVLDFEKHRDYRTYGDQRLVAEVERLASQCELMIVHRLRAMVPVLRSRRALPPVVFDLDDIEHVKLARDLSQPSNWRARRLLRLQLPALRRLERRAMRKAACTLVCSDQDRTYLMRRYRLASVLTLRNSVETRLEPVRAPGQCRLLFVGTFSYGPNVEAANYLLSEVWPRIVSALPVASLVFVGNRPDRIAAFRGAPSGVEFAGFVEDLSAYYAATDVVCCPILSGGGTRIKILEAAAYARPVVTTTIGAEGLMLQPGTEMLRADDADGLASHCVHLLSFPVLAAEMGRAARAAVVERYDRQVVVTELAKVYDFLARPCETVGQGAMQVP